jgi:hypothetical protein
MFFLIDLNSSQNILKSSDFEAIWLQATKRIRDIFFWGGDDRFNKLFNILSNHKIIDTGQDWKVSKQKSKSFK